MVSRVLSEEEASQIIVKNDLEHASISYSLDDTYEQKIASVTFQYLARGHSQEEAEFLAASLVR
jgi:hypothetical protein